LTFFFFQYIENLRRPLRVWTVIECDRDFLLRVAVHVHGVGGRQGLEYLVGYQVGLGIDRDLPFAGRGIRLDVKDFALAFDIDVLPRGHYVEFGGGDCFARLVPDRPQRAVLGTQAPEGKRVDAE